MQYTITYFLFFFFSSYLFTLLISVYYSTNSLYDYTITVYSFIIWLWFMFFSSNIFSLVFFLEVLSALVTLLLITSTFSSTYLYNNLSYTSHSYFQNSTPTAFLQTLMFFFWITLVSSLLLFLLLINFYLSYLTFDWNLATSIFSFLILVSSFKSTIVLSFVWLLFFTSIFINCGLVPFYLWNPTFFNGMTLHSLFFYIYVYYFALFFYLLYVVYFYLNELFTFNMYILIGFLIISTLYLTSLLLESFYINAFLALSSILNSTFLLYALCSSNVYSLLFLI